MVVGTSLTHVADCGAHSINLPAILSSIEAHGHRRAGRERCGKKVVGGGPRTQSAYADWLVSKEVSASCLDGKLECAGTSFFRDDVTRQLSGLDRRQVTRRPTADHGGGELGIDLATHQMIRSVHSDEVLGVPSSSEDLASIFDSNYGVERRMHDKQRPAQRRDSGALELTAQVVDEAPADRKGSTTELYISDSVFLDRPESVRRKLGEGMRNLIWRGNRRHRPHGRKISGCGEHGCAAQAVSDQ